MTFLRTKNFATRISNSRFARNVAIVASGTAAAQAIGMAFAPVITRLYGPEAFGLLGVFTALTGVLVPVAALTYPIAIVLPKEDSDARGIARLSLYIAVVVSTLVAIALFGGGEKLLALLDSQTIAPYVMLIPLFMLFAACQQIAQQWLIRKKQFSITARVAVLQAFIINSAKSGIGWFNPVGAVLILLATAGQALHAAMLWIGIRKSQNYQSNDHRKPASLKVLAKRHCDFPIFRAPQVMINAISQSLPVLMLASFFGPAAAGYYALGKTVMGVPSTLIGKSVGDVFYPRITEAAHNKENLFRLILKATLVLAAVGFLPFALVVAFGPWLFAFVFGSEWITAGEYARWLALWLFFGFLNRPSVAALATLGLQDFFLIYEVASVGLRVLSLYLGFAVFASDLMAISFFSVTGVLLNSLLVTFTLYKSRRPVL